MKNEKKMYLLFSYYDGTREEVLRGVFSTLYKAEQAKKILEDDSGRLGIEEYTLDQIEES
jgi:hypothetical protein